MAGNPSIGGVGEVIDRLISLDFDEIGLQFGVKDEMEKLEGVLMMLKSVIGDAERKQMVAEELKHWLDRLKLVLNEAEDTLDRFVYEDLHHNSRNKKVRVFFSRSNPFAVRLKIAHVIQSITKRLGEMYEEQCKFSLVRVVDPTPNDPFNINNIVTAANALEEFSFVDEGLVFGRNHDKVRIIQMLFDQNRESGSSTLSVIAIAGVGGVGKTTLAQLVYNDEVVMNHFDLRIWICVSDDFIVRRLFTQVIGQISSNREFQSLSSRELQINLERLLNGKRFLIVLDDVWNEDRALWDDFTLPLKNSGAAGSTIIITTRSNSVASAAGAQGTHLVGTISDEECWGLFQSRAFGPGGPEMTPQLIELGQRIVKMCAGLPLLTKVLGSLMHSKRNEQEWLAVLNSGIWDGYDTTVEALNASYLNLPPRLKQCFSYCSLFPKDYEIPKETLVQLWMAQGFLRVPARKNLAMEDIGDEFLFQLCSLSFFEKIENGDTTTFKMHDLIHDLAQYAAQSECVTVSSDQPIRDNLSKLKHLSLVPKKEKVPECIFNAEMLRTFILLSTGDIQGDRPEVSIKSHESVIDTAFKSKLLTALDLRNSSIADLQVLIHELRYLRYLNLSHTDIQELPESVTKLYYLQTLKLEKCEHLKKLPKDIGSLKSLRHLNLSCTCVEALPDSVTKLYYLQTLKLEKCKHLKKLPADLVKLISLRHLHVDSSGEWEEMPIGIGQLSSLRTLPIFKVSTINPKRSIEDLEFLSKQLQGKMEIFRLENVKFSIFSNTKVAQYLKENETIHTLSLQWCNGMKNRESEMERRRFDKSKRYKDASLLESFQPHSNLKMLEIWDYRGTEFPLWVTDDSSLPCLVDMTLRGCYKMECIPSFGSLPCLEALHICEMSNARSIMGTRITVASIPSPADQPTSTSASFMYPSLEQLTLVELPNLEEWLEDDHAFPCLKQLIVQKCPKLKKVSPLQLPSLTKLSFEEVGGLAVDSILTSCLTTSLKSLSVSKCKDFKLLPGQVLQKNSQLERLQITHCSEFEGLCLGDRRIKSLQILKLSKCPRMSSLDLQGFVCLRELTITSCGGRLGGPKFSLQGLQFLSALEKLKIGPFSEDLHHFPLPEQLANEHFSSLHDLRICGWSTLESVPVQLQHIMATVKFLWIRNFSGMKVMPEWLFCKLSSLQRLVIQNCENLDANKVLEDDIQQVTSLRKLYIENCPLLQERWSLTRNLSHIKVKFEVPPRFIW